MRPCYFVKIISTFVCVCVCVVKLIPLCNAFSRIGAEMAKYPDLLLEEQITYETWIKKKKETSKSKYWTTYYKFLF